MSGHCPIYLTKTRKGPSETAAGTGSSAIQLDIADLDKLVVKLFSKGLAESTQQLYESRLKRYLTLGREGKLQGSANCVVSVHDPSMREKLKLSSVKCNLSGVRFLHISEGEEDHHLIGFSTCCKE